MSVLPQEAQAALLTEFRNRYHDYVRRVEDIAISATDSVVIARLGDDLAAFTRLVVENQNIFEPAEFTVMRDSLALIDHNVRLLHQDSLDHSHHGVPVILTEVHTGQRGRPKIVIDPQWLAWAYGHQSVAEIARFLNVNRQTVRSALLEYGLATPQEDVFANVRHRGDREAQGEEQGEIEQDGVHTQEEDGAHDGEAHQNAAASNNLNENGPRITSYTRPFTQISDEDLDTSVRTLHQQYSNAGVVMMQGYLRALGIDVSRERVRQSLLRVDPVERLFGRIRIERRQYQVAGPNALWHHDGQHGLIRYRIVVHGFIDGYSRLIVGLRASNNNRAATVLNLFLTACSVYGVPSRVRGDHGTENLEVACWMEDNVGTGRGSYIWGRSVHNVRIERLWVDVKTQILSQWQRFFSDLELHHGLNINNMDHILLLHYLFLPMINSDLAFFASGWNHHKLSTTNRTPSEMFGWDMYVHGIRGYQLPHEQEIAPEDLEYYGVDFEGLNDPQIRYSVGGDDGIGESTPSFFGRAPPPERMNTVEVETDEPNWPADVLEALQAMVQYTRYSPDPARMENLWTWALVYMRTRFGGDIF